MPKRVSSRYADRLRPCCSGSTVLFAKIGRFVTSGLHGDLQAGKLLKRRKLGSGQIVTLAMPTFQNRVLNMPIKTRDRLVSMRMYLGRCLIMLGRALTPEASELVNISPLTPQSQPISVPQATDDMQPAADQIRQLFYAALEAQTPDNLIEFVEFCNRFRRHSIFNARLIQTQRRGARACATVAEWHKTGRYVLPDAQPIIILWPFGPTAHVYDVEDTGPVHDRAKIGDPFAATSSAPVAEISAAIDKLVNGCAAGKQFHIEIVGDRLEFSLAGSVTGQGMLPITLPADAAGKAHDKAKIELADARNVSPAGAKKERLIPSWRVKMNDRMTPAEQLVTIAHELGHIFCGHLGGCGGLHDQSGWPDRRALGNHEQEMEAEAVAWLIAQRAGVLSASAAYLRRHVEQGQPAQVDTGLVAKAAARIEGLTGLRYSNG